MACPPRSSSWLAQQDCWQQVYRAFQSALQSAPWSRRQTPFLGWRARRQAIAVGELKLTADLGCETPCFTGARAAKTDVERSGNKMGARAGRAGEEMCACVRGDSAAAKLRHCHAPAKRAARRGARLQRFASQAQRLSSSVRTSYLTSLAGTAQHGCGYDGHRIRHVRRRRRRACARPSRYVLSGLCCRTRS